MLLPNFHSIYDIRFNANPYSQLTTRSLLEIFRERVLNRAEPASESQHTDPPKNTENESDSLPDPVGGKIRF
jgi:hypothetical protein